MARKKNALRKHYIAPYTAGATEMPTEKYQLAKWITKITDDSDENTEKAADYAGDGTEVEVFTGRSEKWNFEGTWDPADQAQAMIDNMKRTQSDSDRMVLYEIVETSGRSVFGVASATGITTGSGDASDYEEFKVTLSYTETPTITEPETPGA